VIVRPAVLANSRFLAFEFRAQESERIEIFGMLYRFYQHPDRGDDQTNIIASLVGRSLGFRRVVTKVDDEELAHICIELGLTDTIIPDLTIGRYLADIVEGQDIMELALMIKGDARVFSFVARGEDENAVAKLGLPPMARVVCLYREEEFLLPEKDTLVHKGDEVVILSHRDNLKALQQRWGLHAGKD